MQRVRDGAARGAVAAASGWSRRNGWWVSASAIGSRASAPATSPAGRKPGAPTPMRWAPRRPRAPSPTLSCWVRAINRHARRDLETAAVDCERFCRDECIAIEMISACQHNACPAMRACAFALLGCSLIDEVVARGGEPLLRRCAAPTRSCRRRFTSWFILAGDAACERLASSDEVGEVCVP